MNSKLEDSKKARGRETTSGEFPGRKQSLCRESEEGEQRINKRNGEILVCSGIFQKERHGTLAGCSANSS